jgi:thioredoxin reductase
MASSISASPDTSRTDVLVVGGGPAGSATALLLASAGHAVVVRVRWAYNWSPEPGSAEADLYENYLKPVNWLEI